MRLSDQPRKPPIRIYGSFDDLDRRARQLAPEQLDAYLALQRELTGRGEDPADVRKALERYLQEHAPAKKK